LRLLLDSHLLVWLLTGDERVSSQAQSLIDDRGNASFASVVSIWEVAVKWPLRRGSLSDMPLPARQFTAALSEAGIPMLDSTPAHAIALEALPLLHGDPFDRLLLATARAEGMTLLTADTQLAGYGAGVQLI
jgi:PIN domain nuclease of toxin-antitoxin system